MRNNKGHGSGDPSDEIRMQQSETGLLMLTNTEKSDMR